MREIPSYFRLLIIAVAWLLPLAIQPAVSMNSTPSPWPGIVLRAASGSKTSTTAIYYIPGTTRGLDPGYDAGLFEQNPVFGIYTRLLVDNEINFAIQSLPDNDYENLVIPVGLNATQGSAVNFSATVNSLPSGIKVFLEDKLTGQFNRLDETGSIYSLVLSTASHGIGRFYIHTKSAGLANAANSMLTPVNTSLIADGTSTQLLTVQAKDANNNNLARGGSNVRITRLSGTGNISTVSDHNNGTYTATVTSPVEFGQGVFVATLDDLPVKNGTDNQATATITYTIGPADASRSTLTPVSSGLIADGSSTQLLTVQAKDINGNSLLRGGATVLITKLSGIGTVSAVSDHRNGTYTATVTSTTETGQGIFVATLNGSAVKSGTNIQTESVITFSIATKVSTGSGSWFTPGAWTPSGIPTADSPVRIIGGHTMSIDKEDAICKNILIESDGAIIVDPGKSVTIGGDLVINGKIEVNSDAGSSGSILINGVTTGNLTYNRFLTGGSNWHLISSPVKEQSIQIFALSSGNKIGMEGTVFNLGQFIENQYNWSLYTTENIGSAGAFISGQGYRTNRTSDGTVSFTGSVQASVSVAVIRSQTENSGWNLVGNPFPSFININGGANSANNFISLNSSALEPSHVGVYYWNHLMADYEPVNHSSPAGYLAPGQGFFIHAAGNSTISFTPALRAHPGESLNSNSIVWPEIELVATNYLQVSKTRIRYIPGMTKGLDTGYDCGTFFKDPAFGVYTRLIEDNGVNFTIQCLQSDDYENLVVPVGLNATQASAMIFSAKVTNLPTGIKVFLEDRLTNSYIRLDEPGSSYSVTLNENSRGTGRFFIYTTQRSLGIDNEPSGAIKLISLPLQNRIRILGSVVHPAELTVFDMNGRVLFSTSLIDGMDNEIRLPENISGILVLQVRSGKSVLKEKAIWIR